MLCKYCTVGYWVAMLLALGGFAFCMVLTSVYDWELSGYGWMTKGIMLSIGLVLAVGLWQTEKRANYISAWVLALVGLVISAWQIFTPHEVCALDCDRPIFMLGSLGMTPLITSMTLFAILLAMTTTMIIRNKKN